VTARNLIANTGTQTYMLRGTDVEQHVVQIDGADMVSSRQGRMETVRLPPNAVADSQVKTGGADAPAAAGLGVVFNVTTRVGTNRLSGTAGSPSSEPADGTPTTIRSACPRLPRARKSRRRWGDRFGPIARGSLPRISFSIATVRSHAPRSN
jgi:hypothetical protein